MSYEHRALAPERPPTPPIERAHDVTRWNTATLKEFIQNELHGFASLMAERDRRYNERFDAQEKAVSAALAAAEKAVTAAFDAANTATQRADEAQTTHNLATNQYREQLREQAATLTPREVFERAISRIESDIGDLRKFVNQSTGRQGATDRGEEMSLTRLGIVLLAGLSFISIGLSLYATFHH
jgi:hypothetical protein